MSVPFLAIAFNSFETADRERVCMIKEERIEEVKKNINYDKYSVVWNLVSIYGIIVYSDEADMTPYYFS